jgi:kynurenine formamidase
VTTLATLTEALATGAVRVVDLTHTLDPDFPVIVLPAEFGQCARFRMDEVSAYDHRGPAWKWHTITMSEHTGTHFDAPIHWVTGRNVANGATDAIDPAMFVGPVCVIDCSAGAAQDDDFTLEPAHIDAWEAAHGPIPAGAWVLMRTDWSQRSGAAYLNLQDDGAHSPGPSPAAIRALLARDIRGFGTECIGTDAGQAQHFNPPYPAHALLHGAGKFGLQCLRNLHLLPPTGAVLICPPLKIKGGTGSPLRVLALTEDTP